MADAKKLFRPKALERLSTPEQLDLLLRVSAPRGWLPVLTLGLLFAFLVGWSIEGRIPVTVDGRGALIYPHGVVAVQAPTAGRLVELRVKVGDTVKQGDVLAVLDLTEMQTDLDHQQELLAELRTDQALELEVLLARHELERQLVGRRRADLERSLARRREHYDTREGRLASRVAEMRATAESEKKAALDLVTAKRASLEEPMRLTRERIVGIEKRIETLRALRRQQTISEDDVLAAERTHTDESNRILNLQNQIDQLDRDRSEAERTHAERMNQIQDIELQIEQIHVDRDELTNEEKELAELAIQESKLAQEAQDMRIRHEQKLKDQERKIAKLEVSIAKQGTVRSDRAGRILELNYQVGHVVTQGAQLGTLAVASAEGSTDLVCVAYFTVNDGKRLATGMVAQVTPDVVKRERFGSIVAAVDEVAPYPVTTDAVVNLIGNREVASRLVEGGRQIEVRVRLETDGATRSGYAWTSSTGPDLSVSSGTTGAIRVVVEQRRPISFVIPYLRSLGGE